jgi:PAS domain S-box-containing protein
MDKNNIIPMNVEISNQRQNTHSLKDTDIQTVNNLPDKSGLSGKTQEELIHDLQIHQVELEIQAEELRQARFTIEESRDQFLDLYEFAPVGYITLSDKAIIIQANLTAATLLQVDRKKLVQSRFRSWVNVSDRETWDHFFSILLENNSKFTETCLLRRKDGSVFPARLEGINLTKDPENLSIRIAIIDISDIKKAEIKLKESEERFRLAIQRAHVSVFIQNTDLVYQWAYNQQIMNIKEITGKRDIDIFTQEDAQHLIQQKKQVLKTGNELHEKVWMTINGNRMFFEINLHSLHDENGNITGVGSAILNLTEQKISEEALRQSEETLQQTQEILEAVTTGTEVIIAAQDEQSRYIFFNQAYKDEIGRITGKELILGSRMCEIFKGIPHVTDELVKTWERVLLGENIIQQLELGGEEEYRRVYLMRSTPIRNAKGNITGVGEVAYNITSQVVVEEELRETKEYLNNLITYANAPIIVWDPHFNILLFNHAFEKLTGKLSNQVIGKKIDILFHEQDITSAMELIKKTIDGERWDSVEIPILHKDGEIKSVLWNSAFIYDSDGQNIISTIAHGQDITARKKIESSLKSRAIAFEKLNETLNEEIRQRITADARLKKTLSLLHASLESTADGIFVIDQQGKITSYNQNFVSMWNIPRNILATGDSEMVLNLLLPQLKNPEQFVSNITNFHLHPNCESFDMIEFLDGKIFERYSKPQIIEDVVVGRVWSFRDITERKRAETKLLASLDEKEILLREIHHRVKNNLQLISGLLDMTRMRTIDESIYNILTDMMLKIQTMAQIHTRLYESKQFGKINITDQIKDQSKALSDIYSKEGHEITCEFQSDDIFLPVDLALPCALVVNEILSNAYKHAFAGKEEGMIKIRLYEENGEIRISICDNGIGIPNLEDVSRSNSLGVKLIRTLVQHQLKGTLNITSNHGTQVLVHFPYTAKG